MSDRAKITAGLAVFFAVVAFPVWQTIGAAGAGERPELELPQDATSCIADTEYMRAFHMDLLNDWRNAVVRDGERDHVTPAGETFAMSLTGTCMDCHSNRETFCTRCHDYANVTPKCWECHVEPEGN